MKKVEFPRELIDIADFKDFYRTPLKNDQPGFYAAWTRSQLVEELVRINKLLNDIKEITHD